MSQPTVNIHDKEFELFIDQSSIEHEVARLGVELTHDYSSGDLVFVVVLSGAATFSVDLMKLVDLPWEVLYVKINSYSGTQSTGRIHEVFGCNELLNDKHVVILDDIVDTGATVDFLKKSITEKYNTRSIRTCAFLFKPDAFIGAENPNYIGFEIPNRFVVGYGLDYDEKGRNLKGIYQLKEQKLN
jgi:hypoxanthine phosphoribosyltransferase